MTLSLADAPLPIRSSRPAGEQEDMYASLSVRFQLCGALIDLGITPDNGPFVMADPGKPVCVFGA
jgi:hypothetical protein